MQTYDLVMLVVLGGTTLFGFMKGIARQVASLISIPLCVVCAYRFHDKVEPMLSADPRWRPYLAMLVLYCGASFVFWFAFRVVARTINQAQMSGFDRQMGGLLGAAKGGLLCTVITFFAVSLSEQSRAAVLNSTSGKYIAGVLHEAKPIIHDKWDAQFGALIDQFENGLDPSKPMTYPSLASLGNLSNLVPQQSAGTAALAQQLAQSGAADQWLQAWQQSLSANMPAVQSQVAPYQNPTYAPNGYQPNPYQPNAYQPPNYGPQYGTSYAPQPYAQPPQYGQPYAQPYANPYAQPNTAPYGQPYAQPYGQQSPYYGQPQPPNPYAAGS